MRVCLGVSLTCVCVCVCVCARARIRVRMLLCLWVPAQQKPPVQLSAQVILQVSPVDSFCGPRKFVAQGTAPTTPSGSEAPFVLVVAPFALPLCPCLLYTSDAADE